MENLIKFAFDSLAQNPRQQEALSLSITTPVLFYGGAKGGGKSHLVRVKEIMNRLAYPGTKGLIVRKTYPELQSNHIRKIFEEYPHMRKWYNKSEKIIEYPNGSITEFSYLKRTDDVYNFQGREYENISIDEVTQHEFDVFRILRTSLRTTRKDITPTFLLTGNPGGIGHQWVKRVFIDRKFTEREHGEHYAFVQAKVYDNTFLMSANPDYVQWLEDLPDHLRKAYLEGDWNIFAGQAFSELSYSTHLIPPFSLPQGTRYIAGYDHGFNHPFSFVIAAIVPEGTVYITHHVTGRLMETPDIVKSMIRLMDGKQMEIHAGTDLWSAGRGGGPSEFEHFRELLDQSGYQESPMIKAKTDREQGVSQIRRYITPKNGKPMLYFFNTDSVLDVFNTTASMQFDDRHPEDVVKMDADPNGEGGDDAYDAFRYLLMSRVAPNSPLEQKPAQFTGQAVLNELMEGVL